MRTRNARPYNTGAQHISVPLPYTYVRLTAARRRHIIYAVIYMRRRKAVIKRRAVRAEQLFSVRVLQIADSVQQIPGAIITGDAALCALPRGAGK